MAEELLGFTGMIAAGQDPCEAWEEIHTACANPGVRAIFDRLAATAEGRDTLADSRARWAAQGLPPPWEDAVRRG